MSNRRIISRCVEAILKWRFWHLSQSAHQHAGRIFGSSVCFCNCSDMVTVLQRCITSSGKTADCPLCGNCADVVGVLHNGFRLKLPCQTAGKFTGSGNISFAEHIYNCTAAHCRNSADIVFPLDMHISQPQILHSAFQVGKHTCVSAAAALQIRNAVIIAVKSAGIGADRCPSFSCQRNICCQRCTNAGISRCLFRKLQQFCGG